jgi:hypothetical protein
MLTLELRKDDNGQPGELLFQIWFEEWKARQLAKGPAYFEALTKYREAMRRIRSEEMLKGQAFGL